MRYVWTEILARFFAGKFKHTLLIPTSWDQYETSTTFDAGSYFIGLNTVKKWCWFKSSFRGAFMNKYLCLAGILLFPITFLLAESPKTIKLSVKLTQLLRNISCLNFHLLK